MIDLTINKTVLDKNIRKAKENKVIIPTFKQMKDPAREIPDAIKARGRKRCLAPN
jgi:hypothetical protein